MTQLSNINDLFKHAFGFERMFNDLERLSKTTSNFPPYNITFDRFKNPNEYLLEMAVAGFSRDDITVKVIVDGDIRSLVISGDRSPAKDGCCNPTPSEPEYVVRMMAARSFKRVFNLAENAAVSDVELKDGMLKITVVITTPEPRKSETLLAIK